ncbi:MAG: ABC transporter permease [Candidatus Bathyarchaeia archaeon]
MSFQRILVVVKKDLKHMVREPALLFLLLLFPVVLTLAFGFSFGAMGGTQQTTFQVGVVNANKNGLYPQYAEDFIDNIAQTEILVVQTYPDNQTAQSDLVQGKIQALLLIPQDFGASCSAFQNAPSSPDRWMNTTVPLYLDSGSMVATQAIPPIVQQVLATTVYGDQQTVTNRPIQIGSPSLVEVTKQTMFDYMAPGLFAYAAIFLTMTVAQSFTTDRETGLLKRINVTPITAAEFMASQVLSNMVIAVAQAILIFVVAYAVGYRPEVGFGSVLFAFTIVLVFSLCNVGFGLITATIAKSSGAATGLSFLFILPQMFLGTFVGAALSSAAQTAGRFVPSYYVTDALTSLFLRKAPVTSPTVLLDLLVVSVLSVMVLALGIMLFKRYGKA